LSQVGERRADEHAQEGHPITFTYRDGPVENASDNGADDNCLASAYRDAGRLAEAILLFERTLADREQVLGDTHSDTLTSRGNFASAYQDAGRLAEAKDLQNEVRTEPDRARAIAA
jgi:tetratricopeptide (TPR) repeat protein